ncbi:extracellular solute-binding protein [Aeromicrobium sp. UC242_57]|uniref:extracellular solute-binding protein n=1 Tax=Aeromicrobium sp. UC242_57 TaxID=3374624 RepID=UPI0037900DE5
MLRRARAVIAIAALAVVAACGSASEPSDAVPTLRWYVGPDRVDPAALAKTCTVAPGGRYRIEVKPLPADLGTRHDRLVRRLLARDDTIDLLSLDSAFVPEFSAANLLAAGPATLTAAVDGAVPWLTEPQVLWFRGNVAEPAGLDPSKPITWDDLIAGAQRLGITIQIDDPDGSGMADWVNALVVGSGGSIVDGPGRDAGVGLTPKRAALQRPSSSSTTTPVWGRGRQPTRSRRSPAPTAGS